MEVSCIYSFFLTKDVILLYFLRAKKTENRHALRIGAKEGGEGESASLCKLLP